MRRRILCGAATGAGLFALAACAYGDVTFGGNARAFAMGGAGLAIVDRGERSLSLNPASLALLDRRFKMNLPGFGFRAHGIPLREAFRHLFGNPNSSNATTLARDFGKRNFDFGVNLNWGFRYGHLEAQATGIAVARAFPNEALQTWARTANGDVNLLTGAEQADLLGGAIYSLPNISIAERVSPYGSPTRIEAGVRIKLMRAIYSHYIVTSSDIRNNTPADPAPELKGGTTLTQDGVGIDFGLLAHPRDHAGLSGALFVTNVIEPNFRFTGTSATGAPVRYDLQPRSLSLGSAYETRQTVLALDLVDLSRAYGDMQARLGAEYRWKKLSFRAGYASARGFTLGIGLGFIDIAFGAKAPLEISQTLRF